MKSPFNKIVGLALVTGLFVSLFSHAVNINFHYTEKPFHAAISEQKQVRAHKAQQWTCFAKVTAGIMLLTGTVYALYKWWNHVTPEKAFYETDRLIKRYNVSEAFSSEKDVIAESRKFGNRVKSKCFWHGDLHMKTSDWSGSYVAPLHRAVQAYREDRKIIRDVLHTIVSDSAKHLEKHLSYLIDTITSSDEYAKETRHLSLLNMQRRQLEEIRRAPRIPKTINIHIEKK